MKSEELIPKNSMFGRQSRYSDRPSVEVFIRLSLPGIAFLKFYARILQAITQMHNYINQAILYMYNTI